MRRLSLVCALFVFISAALGAQQSSSQDQYQGTSNPPADDLITVSQPEQAKPPAGRPLAAQPATPQPPPATPVDPVAPADPSVNFSAAEAAQGDDGIVQVAPESENRRDRTAPRLSTRAAAISDPDGDIVHPHPLPPGVLGEGVTIRVRLLTRLSTADALRGDAFRSRVASDVLQDGKVLIPAGAEIDGHVSEVSSGHAGGHGTIRLQPDTVLLPNGASYQLNAEITGTPGTNTRVSDEGDVHAGSRLKKDGIEYGGAVGAGAITGAALAGPVGALTGSIIGAGAVTVHLLVDHPQATLENGSVLLFTLTQPLNMVETHSARE